MSGYDTKFETALVHFRVITKQEIMCKTLFRVQDPGDQVFRESDVEILPNSHRNQTPPTDRTNFGMEVFVIWYHINLSTPEPFNSQLLNPELLNIEL